MRHRRTVGSASDPGVILGSDVLKAAKEGREYQPRKRRKDERAPTPPKRGHLVATPVALVWCAIVAAVFLPGCDDMGPDAPSQSPPVSGDSPDPGVVPDG